MPRELLLPPALPPRPFAFGRPADVRATQRLPFPAPAPAPDPRTTLPFAVPAAAPVLPFRAPPVPRIRFTAPPNRLARPVLPFVPAAPRPARCARVGRVRGLVVLASTFALGVLTTALALHG